MFGNIKLSPLQELRSKSPSYHNVLEDDDLLTNQRYFGVGIVAALFANIVFFIQRFVTECLTNHLTGWWVNVFGAITLSALYFYYRKDQQKRYQSSIHAGLALCAFCLVIPVLYGMMSSTWWLVILPLTAVLLLGIKPGVPWVILSALLMVVISAVGDDVVFTNAAGETAVESAGSRVILLFLLFGISSRSRWIAERQAGQLLNARDAAQSASEAKSSFLANMSHEIRTPMNGVLGMTSLLLESKLSADQRNYALNISHSGEALLALINDILDLSKIEAGRMEFESRPFNLGVLVNSVSSVLNMRATDKGIGFKVTLPDDGLVYMGDGLRIRQVLFNLVGNAVKFTLKGAVELRIFTTELGLRFEVHDSGIGISEDGLRRLFSNFAQVDSSTTRKFGGTGLGLVISKKLVEGMQGSIGVQSEPGKGSCFYFEIPLHIAASGSAVDAMSIPSELTAMRNEVVEEPAAILRNEESTPDESVAIKSSHQDAERKTILLVEDHPINQKLATLLLERSGYVVDLATDGVIAVEAASKKRYAVILMDIQMPNMNGYEATDAIRRGDGPNACTRIIALTANAMQSDKDACMQAGMNDFLTKPFSKEGLVECIERNIQQIPKN